MPVNKDAGNCSQAQNENTKSIVNSITVIIIFCNIERVLIRLRVAGCELWVMGYGLWAVISIFGASY
jgi:hypothetical protein